MKKAAKEIWFVTGSQHLYGPETLKQVASNSKDIVDGLNAAEKLPVSLVFKPIVTTPQEITALCREASNSTSCIGVVTWMHTFSPAKMWITGLKILSKPLCHLHTQFNAEIPWDSIDMDFMNLNQSAHGDREFGFIMSRMRKNRKVVVGHWKDERVQKKLAIWARVALGADELQHMKVARIGDNMREVAVTEGDKVAAQLRFGVAVNGYDSSDITNIIDGLDQKAVDQLVEEYEASYTISESLQKNGAQRQSLIDSAKIELGLRTFLDDGGFKAFTDTFENLGALKQLPGLAVQRLMADGYGFGAEGAWKTAALTRTMKVMSSGLSGGTSFMEDYTYHLEPGNQKVLGAHMLEVCETLAEETPFLEVHPLGIGGKADPARLIFNTPDKPAINASIIDLGNRFRMVVNDVQVETIDESLPKLPVARVVWKPQPDLKTAVKAWILSGGAHHTGFSQAIDAKYIEDFADIAGIEYIHINKKTNISELKDKLRFNEVYYKLENN